jgi:hypothetical protein
MREQSRIVVLFNGRESRPVSEGYDGIPDAHAHETEVAAIFFEEDLMCRYLLAGQIERINRICPTPLESP